MTLRRRFGRTPATTEPTPPVAKPSRQKGATTGKMRRAKPANVVGRGPLLADPGLRVAIVCIVKDEARYLDEWLAYHFALGVSHVLLYDNGSTDGSAELLARYQNHGLVTVIDWPLPGGQLAAYNHALRFFGAAADWLAYFDVDEFLVPLLDDDIPSLLARYASAADVRVERKEFGYSGHRTPPDGLVIDAYTQLANVLAFRPGLPPRVKSIVQPAAISAVDVHLAFPADVPTEGMPIETVEVEVRGVAQLNHYYTRSFEEFEAKRFRGSATGRIDRAAVPFDLPTIAIDTAAQRFSGRTQEMFERLRRLDAQPYYYGSQLGLSFFPRPNDLGRFAEFALANTAAGLDEPQRVAAAPVKNLHDGVGIVGDLSQTGFEPRQGALAGSVHTQVLVEHMRGRLVSDISANAAGPTIEVASGHLTRPLGEAATLVPDRSVAELSIELPADEMLRCYTLGFMLGCDQPVSLRLDVERADGSRSEPTSIDVPASTCVAGIVEIEATPQHAARARLRLETAASQIGIFDLFLVSYG